MMESALRGVVRRGRVGTEEERRAAASDSWPQALAWDASERARRSPAAVALPGDAEEAAAVLAWAARRGLSVVPRGAGSGVVGAAAPGSPESVVVDLSLLRGGCELILDDGAPRAAVGAGWLGGALEARLNGSGWSLRHFPASMDISTPGGWVAGGSFGQLSTRYGGVGEQAVEVQAALPDGTLRRESAALHLGAEGTLGLMTEATLLLRRLPRTRRFAAWAFAERAAALAACRDASRERPSVLRLYGPVDSWLSLRRSRGGGGLLHRLEPLLLRAPSLLRALAGATARNWTAVAVYEEEEGFAPAPSSPPGRARDLGPEPARVWWERRYQWSRDRLLKVFAAGCFADTLDLWAPWDLLGAVDDAVLGALSGSFAFRHFGHFDAAGACLYVTFAGAGGPAAHARAWEAGLSACAAAGGRVNHHHGVGLAKLRWLRSAVEPARLAAWEAEKRRRDPAGLLNPGRLLCP